MYTQLNHREGIYRTVPYLSVSNRGKKGMEKKAERRVQFKLHYCSTYTRSHAYSLWPSL